MDLLTRGVLGKRFLKTKRITVPELNADVIVRELSAGDALKLSEGGAEGRNAARIAVSSIVDEEGELLFKPEEAEDLASRIPPAALNLIVTEVVQLSGLGGVDPEKN